MDFLTQLQKNLAKSPEYEADTAQPPLSGKPLVRLIAYYLPQFHPIPENDEWWGRGFTEWTNVTKALPRFEGHYQPQLPGGLGFYDLRYADTLRAQADLAQKYGVSAFCFHHYWFQGKPLLETPLKVLLDNPDINISFCINWANETWSRRWDASNNEVLIHQKHSAKDDLEFAASLRPLFSDPRYVKIDGRPLFMVYRPGNLPDAAATIRRWRSYFEDAGLSNPYIVMPQAGNHNDPREFGFDAAAGFPPHNGGWEHQNIRSSVSPFRPWRSEHVARYDDLAQNAMMNDPEEFTLLPGVCPAWDNTARRPNGGFCFIGSSPKKYGDWLHNACEKVIKFANPDERIVFINAWNEWAEGAHLEPDIHYGYAFLMETSRVLNRLGTSATHINARLPFLEIQKNIVSIHKKLPFFRRLIRKMLFVSAYIFDYIAIFLRFLGEKLSG
jgi:lipopolysaccharide biosynthesis protein